MAENVKYKYKADELDSGVFRRNLLSNYESYVKHQGYSPEESAAFKNSFESYLNAFDAGQLSTEYDGSITDASGMLKDEGFNQHVAKYFNIVGDALSKKTSKPQEVKKPKFSLNEHGLWQAFGQHISPSGSGDLQAWLDLDKMDDKTKTRGISQRVAHFNSFLDQYMSNFGDYDFTGTPFKNKEDYFARLNKVKEALADNTISDSEYLVLNQAGLNPSEYRTAFATGETVAPPEEEEPISDLQKTLQGYKETWDKAKVSNKEIQYYGVTADPEKYKFNEKDAQIIKDFLTKGTSESDNFALSYLLKQESQPETEGDYAGWHYVPSSYDPSKQSILLINPTTEKYKREFAGYVPSFMKTVLEKNNRVKNPNWWMASYNKEGGKFQQGGSIDDFIAATKARSQEKYNKALEREAEASGESKEWVENQRRSVGRKQASLSEKDSEWDGLTALDYAQLGTIAADLYSGISDPVTGTIAGVGSSIAQAGLDLANGRGLWSTAGSLLGNLALDAVSIIPVVGDALGSGTKVIKGLTKFASKLLPWFATGMTVAGGGQTFAAAYNSLSKLGKDGKENEFTVQDFRNIADGISLLIQGKRGLSNIKSQKQAVKNAQIKDTVDVKVKQNGSDKVLRFSDENIVKKLREAKTPEQVNDIIKQHAPASYRDAQVQTQSAGDSGMQWIWKRGTTDGQLNSLWSLDNFRSPWKSATQRPAVNTALDYDALRGRQKAWGSFNVGIDVSNKYTKPFETIANPFRWTSKPDIEIPKISTDWNQRMSWADRTDDVFFDKQGGHLILKADNGSKFQEYETAPVATDTTEVKRTATNIKPFSDEKGPDPVTPTKQLPVIQQSKIARLGKLAASFIHNKEQEKLAHERPVRYDQVSEMVAPVVAGNYDLQVASEQAAANIRNSVVNSATTDSAANREMLIKATIAGEEGKMKTAAQENAAVAAARARQLEVQNMNAASRNQTANANKAYALKKADDDYAATAARKRADYESTTNALNEVIGELKPAEQRAAEMRNQANIQNYQTEIIANPNQFGLNFDAATVKLVQDVTNGTRQASDLTDAEKEIYNRAKQQIQQAVQVRVARDNSVRLRFTPTAIESPYQVTVVEKDGGKITIAKIKKKIEKAKLQQRQIEDRMRNYQKDLDRLQKRSDTYKKEN